MNRVDQQPVDARQLILDADFDLLMVPESTVERIARQWAAHVGTWLGMNESRQATS